MVRIVVTGLKETIAHLEGSERRTRFESKRLPKESAGLIKTMIKATISAGQRYIGSYHRFTGTGLVSSIQKRKVEGSTYIVQPNPNLSGFQYPGGKSRVLPPSVYANYVEFGTSKSKAKHYFRDGVRMALPQVNRESRKSGKNIVRK